MDERLCRQCASGKTENEVHFMFECDKYTNQRSGFLNEISQAGLSASLIGAGGLREIFTSECPKVLYSLGKYVSKCMEVRT